VGWGVWRPLFANYSSSNFCGVILFKLLGKLYSEFRKYSLLSAVFCINNKFPLSVKQYKWYSFKHSMDLKFVIIEDTRQICYKPFMVPLNSKHRGMEIADSDKSGDKAYYSYSGPTLKSHTTGYLDPSCFR
jgi:hypothetical protein